MTTCYIHLPDVYRYLGYGGYQPDHTTQTQIDALSQRLETVAQVKGIYRSFPLEWKEGTPYCVGTTLGFEGNSVSTLLKESSHCMILAITLGHSVDTWLKQLQVQDMSQAVIADACASSLVEQYCDQLEEEARGTIGEKFFTDRFSPGYGDLPLSTQLPFCQVLDTSRKIGLSVSSTALLQPKKSITALLGVCDTPQPMTIKGCDHCSLREVCALRKGGKSCGSSTI
ncbi:MAG: methionine synthase [Eubacteriales bacterium]